MPAHTMPVIVAAAGSVQIGPLVAPRSVCQHSAPDLCAGWCLQHGKCAAGDRCPFSHNTFELSLHPERYKTTLCSLGGNCNRDICFFAHSISELRTPGEARGRPPTHSAAREADPTQSRCRSANNHTTQQAPLKHYPCCARRQFHPRTQQLGNRTVRWSHLRQQHGRSCSNVKCCGGGPCTAWPSRPQHNAICSGLPTEPTDAGAAGWPCCAAAARSSVC